MKLWMSAEIGSGVADSYSKIRKHVEKTFNEKFSEKDYGENVESWDHIVILLPDYIESLYDEVKRYDESDKSLEFRLKIDYRKFDAADEAGQIKLVCQSLLRSLDTSVVRGLSSFNGEELKEDFTNLCADRSWL